MRNHLIPRILTETPAGVYEENDPERILPPVGDPAPARASGKPVCEYCECTLTPSGEVLKVSDKAKRFRRHDETIEEKDKQIAKLETEVRELRAKLAEYTGRESGKFDLSL